MRVIFGGRKKWDGGVTCDAGSRLYLAGYIVSPWDVNVAENWISFILCYIYQLLVPVSEVKLPRLK